MGILNEKRCNKIMCIYTPNVQYLFDLARASRPKTD
jgi:hypothetical protein